jgi:hypothetical protein
MSRIKEYYFNEINKLDERDLYPTELLIKFSKKQNDKTSKNQRIQKHQGL